MTSTVSLQILDATLFIDCLTTDVDQAEMIADICGGEFERLRAAGADVVVSDNEDDDPDRATF